MLLSPELEVLVLQILLLSEGGFNTESRRNTAVIGSCECESFVFPLEIVCVVVGIPIIEGGSFEALAV